MHTYARRQATAHTAVVFFFVHLHHTSATYYLHYASHYITEATLFTIQIKVVRAEDSARLPIHDLYSLSTPFIDFKSLSDNAVIP